jgi:hypothetical protein
MCRKVPYQQLNRWTPLAKLCDVNAAIRRLSLRPIAALPRVQSDRKSSKTNPNAHLAASKFNSGVQSKERSAGTLEQANGK